MVEKGIAQRRSAYNPGSEQVRYTAERDGLMDTFNKLEGTRIFNNACGPCIGQWAREGAEKQEKTLSFTRSTETLRSVPTVTRIHTPSLLHQKWLQPLQSLVN